jgi:hypothetical protein
VVQDSVWTWAELIFLRYYNKEYNSDTGGFIFQLTDPRRCSENTGKGHGFGDTLTGCPQKVHKAMCRQGMVHSFMLLI